MRDRVITGTFGIILFLLVVWLGDISYSVFITLLAWVGFYEYLKMNNTKLFSIEGIWGLLIILLIIIENNFITYDYSTSIILLLLIIYLLQVVLKKNKITFDNIGYFIVGILYIGYGFSSMIEIRYLDNGFIITLFIFFITWASDTGAYFSGRYFGKNKLWPKISPKKTIEGSIGGIFSSLAVAVIYNYFFNLNDYLIIIWLSILISIVGQLGDLVESALKRAKNVKDSGSILPGHGGILDRFDSLIFIFLFLYLVHIF